MPDDMIDVTVWVLVDQDGRAVSDCNPDVLRDEYLCDHGGYDPGRASRLYQVTVRVPRPRPVSLGVVTLVEAVG